MPSRQENFGLVVAEAMACGKPVLTTDKVNTWREVQDCGAGMVADDDLEGVIRLLEHFLGMSPEEKQVSMGVPESGIRRTLKLANMREFRRP